MADSAKVRLVRCPKCQNLLPELPDYSVYECGGCGAVLRAKRCDGEAEKVLGRSIEERIRVVSDKSNNFSGNTENRPVKEMASGGGDGEEKVSDGNGSSNVDSKGLIDSCNAGKAEIGNEDLDSRVDELKSPGKNACVSRRVFKRRVPENGDLGSLGRIRRGDLDGAGEGTSRHHWDYNATNGFAPKNVNHLPSRVECVEASREELLRKLDELKDQLSKSSDVNEKLNERERMPLDQTVAYADSDEWFRDPSSGFSKGCRPFIAPNKQTIRPRYYDHHNHYDPLSFVDRSDMFMHNYHPSVDTIGHHTSKRPPSHRTLPGYYMGGEPDPFEQYSCNPIHNQLPCSCHLCHENNQHVPIQIPSSSFCNRVLQHAANKVIPCNYEIPGTSVPQRYHSRICNPRPVCSYGSQSGTRWPGELNLELGRFTHPRPKRVVLANSGRHCHPVAGGAPFIACHSCSELLKLPKGVFQLKKSQWRICCGACSSVISLAIVDDKLVSIGAPARQNSSETLDSSNEVLYQKRCLSRGPTKLGSSSFNSEDYDKSGYDFPSMEKGPSSSDTCPGLNSSKSEELQNPCSLSPSTSEDEDYPDEFVSRHELNQAPEIPAKAIVSPLSPGSPLEEHFDYSSKYRAVNRCGKGNLSSRSDQDRVTTNKTALRQNSLKESLATEMEISLNDYANTGVTHDNTAYAGGEEDPSRGKKGVDSFLSGLIKKSFRDFSRSTQAVENGKRNVTVNGHVIPERLAKKAEKQAGPISPGEYWYDFRAGFWGAMNGPCLGIIPPFIEEFNHPMPEKCAAGNTGVYVNGRELHQKDLDLLSSRGLPASRDRSYIIEISGKVLDEDTGEELDSLGKLAPTVEKVKHGFGMRLPKTTS